MRGFLLVVTGVVALLAIVGVAVLPGQRISSQTIYLTEPPEFVWPVIADIENGPQWRPELVSVKQLPDNNGHPVWSEKYTDGSTANLETIEAVPRRLLVRRIAQTSLPFSGTWTIEIVPTDDGSVVTLREDREIRNPIVRLLARFMDGRGPTVDGYLKALVSQLGKGGISPE